MKDNGISLACSVSGHIKVDDNATIGEEMTTNVHQIWRSLNGTQAL